MSVAIQIQFNGRQLTLPINPEELNLSRNADNDEINIIGIGNALRKADPGLYELTIESFFPSEKSYFYTGVRPKTCVDFIDEIWHTDNTNNNVAKIVTTGLPRNINMYFLIQDFEWDYKAGEEDDIYYSLKIKEYKPYGVKLIKTNKDAKGSKLKVKTSKKSRTASTSVNNKNKRTYKVQKGDCLWNIAKAASGKGSNWKALYNLNKKVIGSNPNLIKPGQILVLPDGWKGSFKVAKLTGTSGKKTTSKGGVSSSIRSKTSSNTKGKTTSPQKAAKAYKAGGGGYMSAGGGTGSKGQGTKTLQLYMNNPYGAKSVLTPKTNKLAKIVQERQQKNSLLGKTKNSSGIGSRGGGFR